MTSCLFRIQYADGRVEERAFVDGQFLIGRASGDVALQDARAADHHGQLDIRGPNVTYTDLGSSSGSFGAHDRRLTGPTPLSPGHSVQIGRSALTFLGPRPSSSKASARIAPVIQVTPGAPAPRVGAPRVGGASPGLGGAGRAGVRAAGASAFSHPARAAADSSPLAISLGGLPEAFRLLLRASPFGLARLAVLGGLMLGASAWCVVLIGGFTFLARSTPLLGWAWVALGCLVAGGVWRCAVRSSVARSCRARASSSVGSGG